MANVDKLLQACVIVAMTGAPFVQGTLLFSKRNPIFNPAMLHIVQCLSKRLIFIVSNIYMYVYTNQGTFWSIIVDVLSK